MDGAALKQLWKCNDQIAALNLRRLADMDLRQGLTPAILSYEGIQYRYMAPGVFTGAEFAYIQEHLRILSGFYGLLRPFDGVTPYRLEMQAKLAADGCPDLYSFWGERLARQLFSESGCILNLASREYSVCVSRYLPLPSASSPAFSVRSRAAEWWKRAPCAKWPVGRWCGTWRNIRS